ncbi:Hypothetical predicted protein [Podarcis lilfordi]|uniref:Uncharacterized protein n=1 Tax=Podarcis lilfordi TaxID=74358 RepID=A0AA35JWG6_9SAUR|nr:Hypothetical predicted protein [Podarcis lilfordi]
MSFSRNWGRLQGDAGVAESPKWRLSWRLQCRRKLPSLIKLKRIKTLIFTVTVTV